MLFTKQSNCNMIFAVLQNGIVDESWSISLGLQPSQPADAIRTDQSSAGEAASANGKSGDPNSRREGGQQEQPGSSGRAGQTQANRRHEEGGRGARARQRQRDKAGKLHRLKVSQVDQGVRGSSSLQLNDIK